MEQSESLHWMEREENYQLGRLFETLPQETIIDENYARLEKCIPWMDNEDDFFISSLFDPEHYIINSKQVVRLANCGTELFLKRRQDYNRLLSGKELEPRAAYARIKKIAILHALGFMQERLHLSWRKGMTKRIYYGSESTTVKAYSFL